MSPDFFDEWLRKIKTTEPETFQRLGVVYFDTAIGSVIVGRIQGFPRVGLCSLWVHEKYRRRGIGQGLLEQYIEQCKTMGLEKVVFECHQTNDPALKLYYKLGFSTTPSDTENCFICMKKI
jgi:ribosomal protein S18 acetylase RimI-like enzyme